MAAGGKGAGRLRAELSKWRGRRRRYPRDLKSRALAFARGRRARGATLAATAAELGISAMTLHGWLGAGESGKKRRRRRGPVLVPVEIVSEEGPRAAGPGPVVVTRGGVRVEGLSIEDVATLLRGLS